MIQSFKHRGLRKFFETGSKVGIQPKHGAKLQLLLTSLNAATHVANMNQPGFGLHLLEPKANQVWAVSVSGNWRLIFRFEANNVVDVDYLDYH